MSAVTQLPLGNPVPERSEATRFMCASVFLGHDDDIRKKLRAYVLDRYHCVADNYGLNVRLLARVVDFFDQNRRRYLALHGLLGALCFLILAVAWFAATPDNQPAVLVVIIVAATLFAIPAHLRYLRHRFGYALDHFARDTFDAHKALEAFRNSRGKLESEVTAQETAGNTTAFAAFEPFVGAGQSIGDWSLLIDTRKGKEEAEPTKFTERELELAIAGAFQRLPFPGLETGERLFVHGTEVGLVDGLLPDRLKRPRQQVGQELLARYRHSQSREARVYQHVGVAAWGDQVHISFFYRTAFRGPMLYIENHARLLSPVWTGYRSVDDLIAPKAGKKIALFLGQTVAAPFVCIAECFQLFGLLRARGAIKKAEKEQQEKIKEQARYNYGATSSLRESFASNIYDHYFEKSDRDLYVKALQKQFLDSVIEFLESKNVDTSDLREQRTYIINSGLIVHGSLQAGAVAVGEEAKASTEQSKRPKLKKAAAGGGAS